MTQAIWHISIYVEWILIVELQVKILSTMILLSFLFWTILFRECQYVCAWGVYFNFNCIFHELLNLDALIRHACFRRMEMEKNYFSSYLNLSMMSLMRTKKPAWIMASMPKTKRLVWQLYWINTWRFSPKGGINN